MLLHLTIISTNVAMFFMTLIVVFIAICFHCFVEIYSVERHRTSILILSPSLLLKTLYFINKYELTRRQFCYGVTLKFQRFIIFGQKLEIETVCFEFLRSIQFLISILSEELWFL